VIEMMSLRRWAVAVPALAMAVALGSPAAAGPRTPVPQTPSAVVLEVQTYNMYFGADLTPLFASSDPVAAASAIWAEMQASMIPERARAVAELIAEDAPDLVGLQEVSRGARRRLRWAVRRASTRPGSS
jgi:hypothetical protein